MKILYFHQHFTTPTLGGGIRSYQFAQQLIKRGHHVVMVFGSHKSFGLKDKIKENVFRGNIDGIDVIQILTPYENNFSLFERMKSFCSFAWEGVKIAMREDYDLIFATSTPLTAGIPGIIAKILRKKTFVFEVRDLWPELPKALGLKNPIMLWGMNILEKWSYKRADGCVGLSPGICEGIKRKSQKNKSIVMIPNGCDLDIFNPSNRVDFNLPGILPTDKVAVFTGAHGIANGLDAVLDMAQVLKKRGRTDIKIVFIGNGKTKQMLIDRAKSESIDNCLFFEPVSKNVLKGIVASATMGLMVLKNIPAFYYGTSPNKFFDYISSGLPIINNYPGWLSDLIKDNNCGVVVEPDNAESFAEGVIYLADNPEKCLEYGLNARKLAEKDFARENLSTQFVDFIEEIYFKKSNQNV